MRMSWFASALRLSVLNTADQAVANEELLSVGDTQLKFYVIPGHTLGTLATMFTIFDQGKPHRAVAWGGTAYTSDPIRSASSYTKLLRGDTLMSEAGKYRYLPLEPMSASIPRNRKWQH